MVMSMKVTSTFEEDKGLGSTLAYRFRRCPYYIFIEVEDNKSRSIETKVNLYFNAHTPGVIPVHS